MQPMHSFYTPRPIVGQKLAYYISGITTNASPPSRRSLRSLLRDLGLAPCVASLSPRARPHSFLAICTDRMAGIPRPQLLAGRFGRILKSLLRRASNPPPSNPASQHRARSVSSSLGQGSKVERISSSLALCHTFDLASAQSQALSSDRAFFLVPQQLGLPSTADRLSLCSMHGRHVDLCLADQTVKIYKGHVAGEAAPYPPPSDPLLATPDLSRILLPRLGSTGSAHILLPCAGPLLRFGFGPIIRLQLRLEPLFLPFLSAGAMPLHGWFSEFAFVRIVWRADIDQTLSAASWWPRLQGQRLRT